MNVDPADIDLARRAGLSLVKKTPRRVEPEDLIACAYLVLLKVLPQWDPARSDNRSHFLWDRIRHRVIDQLRNEREMRRGGQAEPLSLGSRAPADERDDFDDRPLAQPANQDKQVLHAEIRAAVDGLPPRLGQLIHLRYYGEQTQEEVGAAWKVTPGRISQLEKSALEKLRERLAA